MALALLLTLALASSPLPGQDVPPAAPPSRPAPQALAFDWLRDGLLTAGTAALWVASDTVAKRALTPAECRWCDRDPATGADTLHPLDAWGRSTFRAAGAERQAARWSDGVAFGAVPLTALGLQTALGARAGALDQAAEDALMVAEAVALTALVTQVVKFTAGRQRPFAHVLTAEQRAALPHPEDQNLSFFSGHSSFAFATVVSAGTVAELRGREGRWALWAVGLPLATAAPLLRMAADKHYLSDVLVGSAVGAAMGWAVPTLLHPRLPQVRGLTALRVAAGPGSLAVSGAF